MKNGRGQMQKLFLSTALQTIDTLESRLKARVFQYISHNQINFSLKIESGCPTGSIKDRAAVSIVKSYLIDNQLRPDNILCDASSGNFGISLAWVSKMIGLNCKILFPIDGSIEKADKIKNYSAELIYFDPLVGEENYNSYAARSESLLKNKKIVRLNQMEDQNNFLGHALFTAPSIYEEFGDSLTHIFCSIGTGGTLSGIGKFFKDNGLGAKIIGVEPSGSVYMSHFHNMPYLKPESSAFLVDGAGDSTVSRVFKNTYVDDVIQLDFKDVSWAWRRLVESNYPVGLSSALAWAGAIRYSQKLRPSEVRALIICPDHFNIYKSKYDALRPSP